jgi:hypothetical protein
MVRFFPLPHNRTHASRLQSNFLAEVNDEISDPTRVVVYEALIGRWPRVHWDGKVTAVCGGSFLRKWLI